MPITPSSSGRRQGTFVGTLEEAGHAPTEGPTLDHAGSCSVNKWDQPSVMYHSPNTLPDIAVLTCRMRPPLSYAKCTQTWNFGWPCNMVVRSFWTSCRHFPSVRTSQRGPPESGSPGHTVSWTAVGRLGSRHTHKRDRSASIQTSPNPLALPSLP